MWFVLMADEVPFSGAAEGQGDPESPSVTDVPHVPRGTAGATQTPQASGPKAETAAVLAQSPRVGSVPEAAALTDVLAQDPGQAAQAGSDPAGPAPAAPVVANAAQTDPTGTGPVAAGPGLLYYAVYLPTPSGMPGGLPLFLPAAGAAGAPPAMPLATGAAVGPQAPFAPYAPYAPPPFAPPAPSAAQQHNQKLLITGIIAAVFVVHLPWLVYLFAVHACWGTFLESCYSVSALSAEDLADPFAEAVGTPMLFARVVFLMLRVQAVLAGDWGQFSQAMQVSTGAGSFILTRIVAANGLVAEGRFRIWLLAASCAFAFGLLFWAELHLLGDQPYPDLGAQTVLAYIDQNLPVDFLAYSNVEASLKGYLQFLRLADALILGAALAMPTTRKSA